MATAFKKLFCGVQSGYEVTLDRYSLKSPAKKPLILPTLELAKAIAAEWDHQGSRIDANTMPLMSLASTAIDQPQAQDYVAEAIVSYLPSDPVLCRVEENEGTLHQKQMDLLDPILEFVRNHLGLSLEPSTSIFGAVVHEQDSNRVKNYIQGSSYAFELLFIKKSILMPLCFLQG